MCDILFSEHLSIKEPCAFGFCDNLQVKAFILEPGPRTDDPAKGGIIDVDGEVLARGNGVYKYEQKTLMVYDKLQITVDQGLATLFSPR